jgi:MSHA biogenesis protein MshN
MSVINQMLKDLEQRAPEQKHSPNPLMINNKPSMVKIVIISLVVLAIINALSFYIWDLQTRVASSELKVKESVKEVIAHQPATKPIAAIENLALQQPAEQVEKIEVRVKQASIKSTLAHQPATKPIAAIENLALQQSSEQTTLKENVNASKMTVSRRQLTTKELVTQKLVKAEKAVNSNQISKGEKLFEEVLILEPSHQQARKKLAALWFGRQAYQQAVNLLSQGIALDKQSSELRMLKAQIQLKQGQYKGAYHTLKPLPDIEQQDYQVMLANVAQQIGAYHSAITAYHVLIKMQPYSGKWHLGLAIVYDKNSQFTLAEKAYALALSQNDLSNASAEFATQRMQTLGE